MFAFLVVAGVVVLGVATLVNVALVQSIRKLTSPERLLAVDAEGHSKLQQDPAYAGIATWAAANEFEPDLAADFYGRTDGVSTKVLVWKNGYKKTFLAYYRAPEKTYYEFVTILQDKCAPHEIASC